MNRLKLWIFALIVLGGAALGLRWLALDLRKQGIDGIDRDLLAAQARVETAERSLQSEITALAALAAQDGKLADAVRAAAPAAAESPAVPGKPRRPAPAPSPSLSPEQQDAAIEQAAASAVTVAQEALGAAQPGRVVLAVSRDGLARKAAEPAATAFLQDALDRKVRRGYAVLGGKLFAGAALPVGDQGALAVFTPVDSAWATTAAAGTGATVLLLGPGLKTVASGRLADVDPLSRAATRALTPVDAGALAPVDVSPPGLRVQLPPVRSFLGAMPGDRVVARPLAGVKDGRLVLAASTRPVLAPLVKLEWYATAALAAALLLALVFGLLVKPTEVLAPVPPGLLDAARKIERGDWSARAPVMSGRVGTVAAALNKAAEAAQAGPPAVPGPVAGSLDSAFFSREPPAEAAHTDPFAIPARGPRSAPVGEASVESDTARLDGANLSGAAFEAAPVPAPKPPAPALRPEPVFSPEPAPAPPAPPPPAASGGTAPFLAAVPAPPAAAPAAAATPAGAGAGDEEQHWREVFRDFVRTRGECGESAEGLTYERFRQKLETNKGSLVAKYACKTVRFQVYVKEGKAALKATPVR
jgi:hypothetical protein